MVRFYTEKATKELINHYSVIAYTGNILCLVILFNFIAKLTKNNFTNYL